MKTLVKMLSFIAFLLVSTAGFAQNAEMADTMRSEGKIYVVVLMIFVVLGGLIVYLFLIDKKLNKMEKQLREKKQTKS